MKNHYFGSSLVNNFFKDIDAIWIKDGSKLIVAGATFFSKNMALIGHIHYSIEIKEDDLHGFYALYT